MNYSSFKIIRTDGGLFIFCGMKKTNMLIVYLFIRDLISEGVSLTKTAPTKAPIAVYVEFFDNVRISINIDDEPFLDVDFEGLNEYVTVLYAVGRNQVAFPGDFDHSIRGIDELACDEIISFGNFSKRIKKLSFDKYMELFK